MRERESVNFLEHFQILKYAHLDVTMSLAHCFIAYIYTTVESQAKTSGAI